MDKKAPRYMRPHRVGHMSMGITEPKGGSSCEEGVHIADRGYACGASCGFALSAGPRERLPFASASSRRVSCHAARGVGRVVCGGNRNCVVRA